MRNRGSSRSVKRTRVRRFPGERRFHVAQLAVGVFGAADPGEDAPRPSVRRFLISQRGLSGTKNIPKRNSSAGAAVTANIQRQPCCPNHELTMNWSVAPAGRSRTSHQLMICASKTPMTIVS